MEAILFFIVVGVGVFGLVRYQDLAAKLSEMGMRIDMLEAQLRRLHAKFVQGEILQAEPPKTAEPQKPPEPMAAARPVSRPIPSFDSGRVSSIDWENFMGVKLFAWLGGFALFLGMAFFVKYSIDHNLISPLARVIIGYLTGLGVIIGGLLLKKKGYPVTVQTLCAAGISILYATTFACRSFYNFLSPETAFPVMVLITVASFFLAVRLDSKYVALLGLLGGFLTPVLLSTGEDHAIALFSYIALLDAGVAAVVMRKRWNFLITLSGVATFVMEAGWTEKFFAAPKAELAIGIYAVFCIFYLLIGEWGLRAEEEDPLCYAPASLLPLASLGFAAYLLSIHALAVRPGLTLSFLMLLNAQLAYWAVRREESRPVYLLGGLGTFLLLGYWTSAYLKESLLFWGLSYYMVFALMHTALPLVIIRHPPRSLGYSAPLLMLLLILFAMVSCDILSFFMWPFVLMLGMLAVAAAWLAGSLLAAAGTIVVIMACFGAWIFRLPDIAGLPGILMLLGFFTSAFFAWTLYVTRRTNGAARPSWMPNLPDLSPETAAQLPMFSALMPYLLLVLVCVKLKLPNPSDVFGLMLLLGILLLGLARYRSLELIAFVALVATASVQYVWHVTNFVPAQAWSVGWYIGFYALFTTFPFVFRKRLKSVDPWIAGALSGPAHFWLIYNAATQTLGKTSIGLIPALFAIPSLACLYEIGRAIPKGDPRRTTLLAWFGGVALFFITLIIPIQFDKEWITLGWALEGAALFWLYRRVPHEGLKTWAMGLLAVAFARLALNPAVFSYHPRTSTPILNWYLFVYGIAALCYWIGAALLDPPRDRLMQTKLPPLLNGAGTILAFLLLNIEIADYFSTGATITFNFSANLAQDMTYSLAWAVFAIALLLVGIGKASRAGRYASIGLLTVTLCKLFLHDLWQLGGLYRVASFVGLAAVLILVSFLYQHFLSSDKMSQEVRRG